MKYVLFDVAGTLLYKPSLYVKMEEVLRQYGFLVDPQTLKKNHKLLSEAIFFPDRTNADFYRHFNRELLYSLGILPTDEMLDAIFASCSYLPWEKFGDTTFLEQIEVPVGIISNFNSTLKEKLKSFFDVEFSDVFVSEELGVAKPSLDFYGKALQQIGIPASEIIYVGDSIKLDLEPALQLGMKTLLIDRDGHFPLQQNRIDSLTDLNKWL
ncbi:HAD family hydrolase [Flavobacterium caeni]|uniref:Haloacid dehalogenase superfamily, subfamily IA, variant 3 with third motif having DD or ED/haloacid dehalogenase superfamily, subfamily IA, variant 1 with third motif having Dx(3-4)D or Dx(3-4)E n=1 Tax=Flavobacterium caeni TaxID=490189 RepID=A0A1G5FHD7_9FLAO|nr:HAD-IA family hydrolase [Flavobacterium caeni]SCY38514.1 haloacid dehalogenase superfamily, subfamily IA, variant 3 with third motif having DD or ED/haloacid dehalogenase superfamily, subfamily IA, variant 1 with third motif having Dx(3-4)D or Dx(3-4)E [Flavobacterium caeni]